MYEEPRGRALRGFFMAARWNVRSRRSPYLGPALFLFAPWSVIDYNHAGVAMKFALGIAVFCWFVCGLIGAWLLGDLDGHHWKEIAGGPITLATALLEHPVTLQGPN